MWMRLEELLLYFEHCLNSQRIGGLRLFDRSKKTRPITGAETTESSSCEFLSLPAAFTTSPRLAHTGYPISKTFPHSFKIAHFRQHAFWVCGCSQDGSVPRLFTFSPVFRVQSQGRLFIQHCLIILLTADVTAPGADLLRIIYAPNLTDVRLDGFRAHDFEGRWEEHLTEPLSETVRRLSARSSNLQRLGWY